MFEALKAVHLLCLLLGGAASIGNAVLFKRVMASGGPPPPMVADAMGVLGRMGLGAIVVLWLTGIPLAVMTGAFVAGGPLFSLKMLVAALVLGVVSYMTWLRGQIVAGKRPPNMALISRMALVARWAVVLAVILAVIVFK